MKKFLYALGSIILNAGAVEAASKRPINRYTKSHIKSFIDKVEEDIKLPEILLNSIIWQESSYRIKAVNSARNKGVAISSYGLGQLTLDTAKWHCGLSKKEIFNPFKNIKCSGNVLKYQLKRYKGDIKKAVSAYNWGTPCICNGKNYYKIIGGIAKKCVQKRYNSKLKKHYFRPIICNKKGQFFNQKYVDSVLKKRDILMKNINNESKKIDFLHKAIYNTWVLPEAYSYLNKNKMNDYFKKDNIKLIF